MRFWIAVLLGACGDDLALPPDAAVRPPFPPHVLGFPDARPDGPVGTPDLRLVPEEMANTLELVDEAFDGASCALVEQCIGGPGLRRLLKFDTVTMNGGTGDLVLGMRPPDGSSDMTFEWSACHGHHHATGYASYDLLDANGVVITGHKQAFCLQDIQQVQPGAGSRGYNCLNQGLSVGWADVYARSLPCQWIDVTGVPSGTYTLRVRVNPDGKFEDADLTNNDFTTITTL